MKAAYRRTLFLQVSRSTIVLALGLCGLFLYAGAAVAVAAVSQNSAAPSWDENAPVDFKADSLIHDEQGQIITARGNVELVQAGRILRADEIIYSLREERAVARGNVVLNEPSGDTHFADEFEFTDKMRNGYVVGLRSLLADGSRFTASMGERKGGTVIEMTEASYTPCEPCKDHPEKAPLWQLKADKVVHNKDEHRVSYEDASFEFMGVPLLWTPWFAHSDGSIKRKSGFLTPDVGWDSRLGGLYSQGYYWDIAPNHDATFGIMAMTEENPLAFAESRNRWAHAELNVSGSATYSGRTDSVAGEDVAQGNEWRGHLFADGLWDINEKWRSGLNLQLASDDQYLRQYDLSGEDVLENEVYAERFSGRDYFAARALAFQDVRIRENQVDQPDVLPEIEGRFYGDPGALLGGRWSLDVSALGLSRSGNGQDSNRVVVQTGWEKRTVTDFGLVTTLDANLRADAYYVLDRDRPPGSTQDSEGSAFRAIPSLHAAASYPFIRPLEEADVIVEPIAAVTAVPNIDVDDDIPNEDSQDVQVDASNLFEPDRFPGLDRVEDQSRVTYGLRSGLYGHEGSRLEVFGGQSYRFNDDDNPFPAGSGLDRQASDVVGQVAAVYKGDYGLNYRFQLDDASLASERHEVDAYADWDRLRLNTRYLYAKAIEGTEIDESREQIQGGARFRLTDVWSVRASSLHDLGVDPGLRKATFGVEYEGQCMSFSAIAKRNLTRDSSGDSSTEVMFRIGLKNLGEFQTSGLTLDASDN